MNQALYAHMNNKRKMKKKKRINKIKNSAPHLNYYISKAQKQKRHVWLVASVPNMQM
jgi:hypothetical protein